MASSTGCTSVGERLMMPSTSARRRLMFQRFAQFRIALAEFLEQPHILDGDHRLIGEGFEQRDLPFERGGLRDGGNAITPMGDSFSQQRHG